MTIDEERREVARRLREDAKFGWCIWVGSLRDALGIDGETSGQDMLNRLADLIEPSEPKVRCVAEIKVDGERLEKLAHDAAVELTGIDRGALLALAEEADKNAWYFVLDHDEDELRDRLDEAAEDFSEMARRIREALGVSDA